MSTEQEHEDFDWCGRCEDMTRWEGEVCTACGRVWGEPEC